MSKALCHSASGPRTYAWTNCDWPGTSCLRPSSPSTPIGCVLHTHKLASSLRSCLAAGFGDKRSTHHNGAECYSVSSSFVEYRSPSAAGLVDTPLFPRYDFRTQGVRGPANISSSSNTMNCFSVLCTKAAKHSSQMCLWRGLHQISQRSQHSNFTDADVKHKG